MSATNSYTTEQMARWLRQWAERLRDTNRPLTADSIIPGGLEDAADMLSRGPSSSQSEPTFEQKYPHVTQALLAEDAKRAAMSPDMKAYFAALRPEAVHPADAASPKILRAIAAGVEAGGISPDTAARHLRAAADELEMQNRLMPRIATSNRD
jgi:hypothetical protein